MKTTLMSFFICLSFLLTGFIYANWQDTTFDYKVVEMSDFNQYSVREVLKAPEGKTLVPEGVFLGVNDVTCINYSYEVLVDEGYSLSVNVNNILLIKDNQVNDGYDLFDFDLSIYQNGNTATVSISISLRMPETKTEYDLVKGSEVSFDLLFIQEQI